MKPIISNKTRRRSTILIAGAVIQLCAGIIYMWGVFKKPVGAYLHWDGGSVALVASIMMVGFVFGILLGGRMLDRYGARTTTLAGSITMSAGILATSLVTSAFPELLYITYAVIGGLGVGIVYSSAVSNVQKWYFERRGFATGVMVGAFGFSMVIFAPIADALLSSVGVPETFIILGLIFLVVCVPSSLLLADPPEGYTVGKANAKIDPQKVQKQYTPREMLKTKAFYLLFLSMFFVLPAFFILNPQFVTLGMERGLTKSEALLGVTLVGICSASGRLSIAWISDKIGRDESILLTIIITAAGVLMITVAQQYLFLVCLALISFAFGGVAGAYPSATSSRFGTKFIGTNYGLVCLALGASSVTFALASNYLAKGGDYTSSFLLAGATCAISFVLVLLLRRNKMGSPA